MHTSDLPVEDLLPKFWNCHNEYEYNNELQHTLKYNTRKYNNKQQQKVAMTSPVGQEPSSQKIEMTSPVGQQKQDGKWVVSFMMPASFTLETTPEPKDPNVSIREVPARLIAAVRYSGFWSEKSYRRNLAKLQDWIANNRLTPIGEPIWARYNPPFMPWFLRRNEILVPIASQE